MKTISVTKYRGVIKKIIFMMFKLLPIITQDKTKKKPLYLHSNSIHPKGVPHEYRWQGSLLHPRSPEQLW